MPEWSKGADLSSAIERCVGSNPTGCIFSKKKVIKEKRKIKKGKKSKRREQVVTKKVVTRKHSCPSGLRGPSQERISRDAWVRTPPDAFLPKIKSKIKVK